MPRRNPKASDDKRGWKGRLGRKAKGELYVTRFQLESRSQSSDSVRPGDIIRVLVQSVNRRGEGEGTYRGRQVLIVGAADPGITVTARVRKISGGKIIAEFVSEA